MGRWPSISRGSRSQTPGQSIGMIGNSIALNGWNTIDPSKACANSARAILAWIMLFSKGRLRLSTASTGMFSCATGGFTSDQIVSTHLPAALAAGWSYLVILCPGTNDNIDNNFNGWLTTRNNVIMMVQACLASGITPILTTELPKGAPGQYGFGKYNTWVRQYAAANGLLLADIYSATVDPLAADTWKAGIAADNLHPNEAGAKLIGQTIWTAIAPSVPLATVPLPSNNLASVNESGNIFAASMNADFSNPLFLNSAAGLATGLGAGGGGGGSPTGTTDLNTPSPTLGNLQRVTVTSAAPTYWRWFTNLVGPTVAAGRRFLFVGEVEATVKASGGQFAYFVQPNGATSAVVGIQTGWTEDIPSGSVVAMEFTMPAAGAEGPFRGFCYASNGAGSTGGASRPGFFDLTALA